MSILRRQMLHSSAMPEHAVFILISLPEEDRNALFDIAVDDLGARANGKVIVIPCDELGVLPKHRDRAERVYGLPATFLGNSRPLRRELERRYKCRFARFRPDPTLESTRKRLEEIEAMLMEARHDYSELRQRNADLPDVDQRLEGARATIDRLVERYRATFAEYHGALIRTLSNAR